MKLFAFLVLTGLINALVQPYPVRAQEHEIRVMTLNLRYDTPNDGVNAWPYRKEAVAGMLRYHQVDILGTQEGLDHQISELAGQLPGLEWIGIGRDDGKEKGEYCAIFYRKSRFTRLDHGTFWLSTTPEVPGSRSWDAAFTRISTWVKLKELQTGRVLYVFNTHFDHIGVEARRESARLLKRRIAELAQEEAVVLLGDFNTLATDEPYRMITDPTSNPTFLDALNASTEAHYGPMSSWNAFQQIVPDRRIDFIFVNKAFTVTRHAILTDTHEGRFLSDHLPVVADMTWVGQ